ncbi:MAG: PAS domain-containing protein [Rhodospirillaceae bacterium]|nr:PAS domain-containing protein [Rhodospirillaceae bacterium]
MEERLTPGVRGFFEYWKSLPRTGLLPHVRDYLDHARPDLQPNVLMLDVHSAGEINVRLIGTRLVDLTGRELTRTNALDIYAPELRAEVGKSCVTMVQRPCGQLSKRTVKSSGGMLLAASSIALPVQVDTPILGCLATFTEMHDPVATDETMIVVQRIGDRRWIDIGAGIPG